MSIIDNLITDRTQSDVDGLRELLARGKANWTAEELAEFNLARSKGAYNYTDLNRVTEAMDYINDRLVGYGYSTGYQRIEIPHKGGGGLPEGYTELEYIESTGTQYIDTGFKPNQDSEIEILADVTYSGTYPSLFGARNSNSEMFWIYGSNAQTISIKFGSNTYRIGTELSGKKLFSLKNGEASVDDNVTAVSGGSFQSQYSLFLFAVNNAGSVQYNSSSKMYSCIIRAGVDKQSEYIPCLSNNGEVGLYDIVGGKFHGNNGTGFFVAGPEIPVLELDPYLWYESDIPTESLMNTYISNVAALRSVLEVWATTPPTPDDMEGLTYQEANDIEQILVDVEAVINQVVAAMARSNSFTFWSGNRPFPTAESNLGRTWNEFDAMEFKWSDLDNANWYIWAYGDPRGA